MHACKHAQSLSHVRLLATLWTVDHKAPLSMELSRQKYWTGLPLPTSGNLPDQGIKFASLVSPAMASRFFTTVPPWKLLEGSHLGKSRCFMIQNCFMTNSDPQRFQALI